MELMPLWFRIGWNTALVAGGSILTVTYLTVATLLVCGISKLIGM